jgi:hypothetical protein
MMNHPGYFFRSAHKPLFCWIPILSASLNWAILIR